MSYQADERARLVPLKPQLFSAAACKPVRYAGRARDYPFCLQEDHSAENLHASIRSEAMRYFADRDIDWHDGIRVPGSPMQPSNRKLPLLGDQTELELSGKIGVSGPLDFGGGHD